MTQEKTIQLELDAENTKYIVAYFKKPDEHGHLIKVYDPDGEPAPMEPEEGLETEKINIKKINSEVLVEYHRNPYTVCNRNICWRTK